MKEMKTVKKEGQANEVGQKSIGSKITNRVVVIILTSCVFLGVMFAIANYTNTNSIMSSTMTETAGVAATRISAELEQYRIIVQEVGTTARLTNDTIPLEEKQKIMEERRVKYGFALCSYIDVNGLSIFENVDLSEREYFKQAITGATYVGDPVFNKVTNEYVVVVASPLWDGGSTGGDIKGVVTFSMPVVTLSEMATSIKVGKTGRTYIINSDGLMVAHPDVEKIGVENRQEMAKTDKSLKPIAAIEQKMVKGEKGFASYRHEGKSRSTAYAPIPNTNGWSLAVNVEKSEFLVNFYISLVITFIAVILFIVIGIWQGRKLGKSIAEPIQLCVKRLMLLSEGDLTSEVPTVDTKDETEQL